MVWDVYQRLPKDCEKYHNFQSADPQKLVFELVHSGRCEQHGGIIFGNEYIAGAADASFGFKKGQIFFSEFVSFHR